MFEDPQALALIGVVILLAGFVKGVLGLGLPTIAVGLLGLVMAPLQAAALLTVPNLVTNVWQLSAGPGLRALLARLGPMLLGVCLGTFVAAGFAAGIDLPWAPAFLGVALIVYAALGLASLKMRVAPSAERWLGPAVGVLTGGITVATGVFVVPAVPYLQALGFEKDDLVQALGVSFLVSTVALALSLAATGVFPWTLAGSSVVALAPALVGMWAGQHARARISNRAFRLCFLGGLLGLGLYLVTRTLA